MKYKLTSLSIYELGQRSNQEDSLYPPYSGNPSDGSLYILCDGMGGHAAGEVASGTVCEVMSRYILSHPRKDGFFDESDFNDALDAAYDALDEKDTDDIKKMGTTLTFVKFHAGGCFTAHIGDSRIYQIRPSERRILHVTHDHSLVNDLVKLGELTPEEARSSRQKNVITRAVQPHQDHRSRADCVNLTDLKAGDYFYMCSDGMLEQAVDDEIVNILSLPKPDADKIQILIGATKDNRDNHSAHLIRIVDVVEGDDAVGAEPLVKPEPGLTLEPEIEPMSQREPAVKEPVPADEQERSHSSKWSMLICLLAVAAVGILAYGFRDKWKFNKHSDSPAPTEIEQDEPEPAPVVAPEPVEMGTVILESVPSGAFVWLDGKETNKKTNMRIDPLPEGKHTFRLVKEGYKDLTGEFVLESGQTLTVKKTLVPKPAPQPNPNPAKPDPAKTETKPAVKDNPTHDTPAKEPATVVLKQINDNQEVKPAEKKEEKKEEKVEEKKEEVIEQGEVAKEENPEEN